MPCLSELVVSCDSKSQFGAIYDLLVQLEAECALKNLVLSLKRSGRDRGRWRHAVPSHCTPPQANGS